MNTINEAYTFPSLCRYLPVHLAPGVHYNVSRETYDSIPYINCSALKKWVYLSSVPSQFKHWLENRWEEEMSEAQLTGLALDCRMLEPKNFERRFITVPPEAPKRPSKIQVNAKNPSPETIRAIAFWDKFNQQAEGKILLSSDQMRKVNRMEDALRASSALNLSGQGSVFDVCHKAVLIGDVFGWPAKAEIDLWNDKSCHILDLKTATEITPVAFWNACDRFGYIEQSVWYQLVANSLGFDKDCFSFVVVRSDEPYPVQVYSMDRKDSDYNDIYKSTEIRLKVAHSTLITALLEGEFKDSSDWKQMLFPPWAVARARAIIEDDEYNR